MKITTARDGTKTGEWDVAGLQAALERGEVLPSDLVWIPSWEKWHVLSNVATGIRLKIPASAQQQLPPLPPEPIKTPDTSEQAPKGSESSGGGWGWLGILLIVWAGWKIISPLIESPVEMTRLNTIAPTLQPLTADDKSELEKIRSSDSWPGHLGHEITQNTRLTILTNDFGEKIGCTISIRAQDGKHGPTHPKWSLRVQYGKDVQNMVWTPNMIDNDAGEIRLIVGNDRYFLTTRVDNEGGRSISLDHNILNSLSSSESAEALYGMFGGKMSSNTYDLQGFKKAYTFAVAICS